MAKKKIDTQMTFNEAEITYQPITETIEKNYMPYVMSVIVSRAIPEIDGFKPSHRKLLYTMYKMGLMTGNRTKSANVVGQTMRLNPHGDAAIYETMVRLTRGNEALLHPFVDSKGSFGKQYSRDMAYAAPRYTEVKLDPFCQELFSGIDKNAVDFIPNYDNTIEEPTLLPTTFPNILLSPNLGIAVGMACSICSFNLEELCDGTIALLKNPNLSTERMLDIVKAPDFSGGGLLVYEREKMRQLYETGVGSVKLRARYSYNKNDQSIDILQIPYSSCIESIMRKIADLIKAGKLKEISDIRDAIDLNGFRLTLELKGKNVDPDKLMAKLYRLTPLEDTFDCNFNILVNGAPRQMGVPEILREWIKFRMTCYRRELTYDLKKKQDKLHLLLGLATILLDIDKAISIIRSTEHEVDVVPNLMEGFSLSQIQAEYIAEIKLRHLNREYILNRVQEIEGLQKEIANIEETLADELKVKAKIADQLRDIKKRYGKPRRTHLIGAEDIVEIETEEEEENYNVRVVMTKEGYFKKVSFASLRGNDEQKCKEGDYIVYSEDTENRGTELFIMTNKAQVYKSRVADFDLTKASALGDYLPAKLKMDEDERPIMCQVLKEYDASHRIVLLFENGKGLRLSLSNYQTKSNRRKLTSAYSEASPIVAAIYEKEPMDILLVTDKQKAMLINSGLITEKATKTSGGVTLFQLKSKDKLVDALTDYSKKYPKGIHCRKRKIPSAGISLATAKASSSDEED